MAGALITPWNLGKTKLNHPGLARISEARKKKNNFARWRKTNPVHYAELNESEDLAELYGTMLGDGCIEKYARTERLVIAFNSKETEHISYIARLVKELFKKNPTVAKMGNENCVRISIYQKNISARLEFPTGTKAEHPLAIPVWIKGNKKYLVRCLKGLFETDGSWVIDPKYNTNCMNYTSIHKNLLIDIQKAVRSLGFYATLTTRRVILSRRSETAAFAKLIKFRQY